jgi:hypothetical protein
MLCLKGHVASVYFKYFRCFRGMLQVFHMDVTKVDREVAYVAMVVHMYCKLLFPIFQLQTYDASVFIWMLHMFYTYVVSVFILMLHMFHTYVVSVFIWMLHMFHAYVASILSGCCVCVYNNFQVFF